MIGKSHRPYFAPVLTIGAFFSIMSDRTSTGKIGQWDIIPDHKSFLEFLFFRRKGSGTRTHSRRDV